MANLAEKARLAREAAEAAEAQAIKDAYHFEYGCLVSYTGHETKVDLTQCDPEGGFEEIGPGAFENNLEIEELVLPKYLTIAGDAFYGCKNLKRVIYDGNEYDWFGDKLKFKKVGKAEKNVSPLYYAHRLMINNFGKLSPIGEQNIPSGRPSLNWAPLADGCMAWQGLAYGDSQKVIFNTTSYDRKIHAGALRGVTGMRVIELGDNYSGTFEVQEYAFEGCPDLEEVIIASYCKVGRYAFANCPNLRRVEIKSAYSEIDPTAFAGCPCEIIR